MKNTMKIVALIAFIFMAFTVSAQTKIGHLSTEEIMEAMPEMKEATAKLNAKRDELTKMMADLQKQYEDLLREYQANSKTYTDAVREEKEKAIMQSEDRQRNYNDIATNQFDKLREELLLPIYEKVRKAIKEVGDEQKFTYIFDARELLYVSPTAAIDVAPFVKKKLNLPL